MQPKKQKRKVTISQRITATEVELAQLFPSVHAVLARVYANRGVCNEQQINHALHALPPPDALQDVKKAAIILADALESGASIMISGDYDVDGATATVLMKRVLEECGATSVSYIIPNRFTMGYGLSVALVELISKSTPQVLITVDSGIASYDAVERAHQHGMKVIITDHHLPPKTLPRAEAVVNPNRADDSFPHKTLAGVGVAFYVLLALRAELRMRDWFKRRGRALPNLARYLDLVALGTIADVVPLEHLNRILVHNGLMHINHENCRPGIRALIDVSKSSVGAVHERELAFRIAPRLNAAGRLEDMSLGVRCLLCDDIDEARGIAEELDELNRQRHAIQRNMEEQGVAMVEAAHDDGDDRGDEVAAATDLPGLCLYHQDWHQGVIGLLATRLSERYVCPVIAFAKQDDTLKGSARSVKGVHILELLQSIDARHAGLMLNFGGHAAAAGLGIRAEQLNIFRDAFIQALLRSDAPLGNDKVYKIKSDGALSEDDICLQLAIDLERGGPWGIGFPAPLFDNEFEVRGTPHVVHEHLRLNLSLPGGHATWRGIDFRSDHVHQGIYDEELFAQARVHAAYRLSVNRYQGSTSVQLVIEHLQPCS